MSTQLFIVTSNQLTADGRTFSVGPALAVHAQTLANKLAGEDYECPRFEIERTPDGAVFRAAAPPTHCFAWDLHAEKIQWLLEDLESVVAAELAKPAPEPAPPSEWDIWEQKLNEGYTDAATGIKLATTVEAKNTFVSHATLLLVALQAGAITDATPQSVWDFDEAEHTLPAGELLGLLLRYGFHWQTMFNQFKP